MASSPKTGGEQADSLKSANAPASADPAKTSQASEIPPRGGMAAFKEKVRATIAARAARPQDETTPRRAESYIVPPGIPRDANGKPINPGGRMILTPSDDQDEQNPSGQERDSLQDVKSG